MGQLPEATGTVGMSIAKAKSTAKQQDLATMIHQFLTYRKVNLRDLNGDYKHSTALMVVPGMYMMKVTCVQGIEAAGIGQVYPV